MTKEIDIEEDKTATVSAALSPVTLVEQQPEAPVAQTTPSAEGALLGVFSVSATTKVQFSKGNLTYNRRTQEWAFYEHQYDRASGYDENLISLFTWVYGDRSSNPSTKFYGFTFTDWGTRMGDGRTWRTLSKDEWEYLIEKRTTSSGIRFAKVMVKGVAGLVVVPDDWSTYTTPTP